MLGSARRRLDPFLSALLHVPVSVMAQAPAHIDIVAAHDRVLRGRKLVCAGTMGRFADTMAGNAHIFRRSAGRLRFCLETKRLCAKTKRFCAKTKALCNKKKPVFFLL